MPVRSENQARRGRCGGGGREGEGRRYWPQLASRHRARSGECVVHKLRSGVIIHAYLCTLPARCRLRFHSSMHTVNLHQPAEAAVLIPWLIGQEPRNMLVALALRREHSLCPNSRSDDPRSAGPIISFVTDPPGAQAQTLPAETLMPQLRLFCANYSVRQLALVWFTADLHQALADQRQIRECRQTAQELRLWFADRHPQRDTIFEFAIDFVVADDKFWCEPENGAHVSSLKELARPELLQALAEFGRQQLPTAQALLASAQNIGRREVREKWLLAASKAHEKGLSGARRPPITQWNNVLRAVTGIPAVLLAELAATPENASDGAGERQPAAAAENAPKDAPENTAEHAPAAAAKQVPAAAVEVGAVKRVAQEWRQAIGSAQRAGNLVAQLAHHQVRDRVILFAVHPGIASVAGLTDKRVVRGMSEAAQKPPSGQKVRAVVAFLAYLSTLVPSANGIVWAMVAYIEWWAGEGTAAAFALQQARWRATVPTFAQLIHFALAVQLPPPWAEISERRPAALDMPINEALSANARPRPLLREQQRKEENEYHRGKR